MTEERLDSLLEEYKSIEAVERKIRGLRSSLERTTVWLSGMPYASGDHDRIGSTIASIIDLTYMLDEMRVSREIGLIKVEKEFDKLPDQQRLIMRLRYIEGMSWAEVAKETDYNMRYCVKLRKVALERLKE